MIRAVLLDYDNTLAKTEEPALTAACELTNEVLANAGNGARYSPSDFLVEFKGTTYRHILAHVARDTGLSLDSSQVDELVAREQRRVLEAFKGNLQPTDFANEALAELREDRLTLAVVSSSALNRLEVCLDTTGQAQYFERDRIFSVQDSGPNIPSKPNPAIYELAIERLGLSADLLGLTAPECLGVEDAIAGMKASVGAGIYSVGYTGVLPPGERTQAARDLFANKANIVIDDLRLLPSIVRALNRGDYGAIERIYGPGAYS